MASLTEALETSQGKKLEGVEGIGDWKKRKRDPQEKSYCYQFLYLLRFGFFFVLFGIPSKILLYNLLY